MMKLLKMNWAPLLALIFAGHVHLHSVNIHPERATGILGGEVQINCVVEFGPNNEMTWDFNTAFVYIIAGGVENYPLGTSKYSVQRTGMNFALTIADLSLEDGGEYTCTSFTSEAKAYLVVLETPSITLNPPLPVEGKTAKVNCEARFGGPKKDLILPDHYPILKMDLNGTSFNETLIEETTNHLKDYYMISMTKNLTVDASMNKKRITCEMGTAEPSIKTSSDAILNVFFDPSKSVNNEGNDKSYVIIVIVVIIIIIVIIAAAAFFVWKKIKTQKASRIDTGIQQELESTEPFLGQQHQEINPETEEWLPILQNINREKNLDKHGEKFLEVLNADGRAILQTDPSMLNHLIGKACTLINSKYYGKIIEELTNLSVVQGQSGNNPLKNLLKLMKEDKSIKILLHNKTNLLSIIQVISQVGDVKYRTECLRFLIIHSEFVTDEKRQFQWSEKLISTLKVLLDGGADPTWIPTELVDGERKNRITAQDIFFTKIFYILWKNNELHESILQVLPLMSKKCTNTELHRGTVLHALVEPRWAYIATQRKLMPPNFFHQFKDVVREILKLDATLVSQEDHLGRTPLQLFMKDINFDEGNSLVWNSKTFDEPHFVNDVKEIIKQLESPDASSAQDSNGQKA